MPDRTTNPVSPFVCDMNAIAAAHRKQHIAAALQVFRAVQTIQELPNGYTFRLPNETTLLMQTVEFMANERLCCPFLGLAVEIEPEGGPLWLRLTGRDGVKPFIKAEIGEALNDTVAQAANFRERTSGNGGQVLQ